jgi:hypothetical protein
MNKNAFIEKWGIVAYEKRMKMSRDWRQAHPENTEKWHKQIRDWKRTHPIRVKRIARDSYRKHRQEILNRQCTDTEGMRRSIRAKCGRIWALYKNIIAPGSRLHYEWIPETVEYKCIALVEKDQSQYSFNDVIHIPVFHRGRIAKYLISKHILREQLMPAFMEEEELQAGVKEA